MQNVPGTAPWRPLKILLPLLLLVLAGCNSLTSDTGDDKTQQEKDDAMLAAAEGGNGVFVEGTNPSVDLAFLLSMDYKEAKTISTQSAETTTGARIAADSIEVLKTDKEGKAKKLRAKGKVYVETGAADGAKILCQEAYIDSSEAVLRGKPILQRGGSIVEGLDDKTVFYMIGTRLRVIGLHRLTNQNSMIASLPDLGPWTGGPNPLLPALDQGAVPRDIRAEMLKAAEAEAVLQDAKLEAEAQPDAPPAPWIKNPKLKPKPGEQPSPKTKAGARSTTTAAVAEPEPEEIAAAEEPKRKASAVSMRR
jgi:hypothetical protein